MLTTFLVVHPWITTAVLVGCVVVGPIVGYLLVERRKVALWCGVASLAPVAALTLFPANRDLEVGCAVEWSVPTLGAVELMANVVLFVPPVLLIGIAWRRPLTVMMAASAGSALIETAQAFITALGRSCSTNDWLSNTVGAGVGAVIAMAVLWAHALLASRRSRRSALTR